MTRLYASRLRESAYDVVVVSPHLDDAVYSLAGTMLEARRHGSRVLVVTVFGHGGDVPFAGTGRFDDFVRREVEDRHAMDALDVDYALLNLPSILFRKDSARDRRRFALVHAEVASTRAFRPVLVALGELVHEVAGPGAVLYLPLGVGFHPDHRLVCEAGRAIAGARRVAYYEDVPYALHLGLTSARLAHVTGSAVPSIVATAWALVCFATRGPLLRAMLFLPALAYAALSALAFAMERRHRLHAEPLVAEERDIGAHLARKADAIRLYATQTPLFFRDPDTLEGELPRRGEVPIERTWSRVPP